MKQIRPGIKMIARQLRRSARVMLIFAVAALVTMPAASVAAQSAATDKRQRLFTEAAREFGVPVEILLALSYSQSRLENHKGKPSVAGGYGLTHLTAPVPQQEDMRGDPARPLKQKPATPADDYSLNTASKLLNISPEELKTNDRQNVRGGASVLAKYMKEANNGKLSDSPADWYAAVMRMGGSQNNPRDRVAQEFADSVYTAIGRGFSQTTTDGQHLSLSAKSVQPNKSMLGLENLGLSQKFSASGTSDPEAECPVTITCKFVPARHAQNDPNKPSDYGNYDVADRPNDGMKIKYIVIHDMEGSYESSIKWFQDPTSYTSAHYMIRSSDGEVTQMVKNKDVGWHARWYMNMHSLGVEHEGFAAEGGTWYTDAMYRSSAKLVRYLARKYNIPLDRQHILGHDQFHGLTPDRVADMHTDPGPYWDWDYYMKLIGAPGDSFDSLRRHSKVVTIAPQFSRNRPEITECKKGNCAVLPSQGANFVYVRTQPSDSAPLVTDRGLHPDLAPGTTEISDWSAKATAGQHFVVADRQGDWTAIWFGGQKGWFYNPRSWHDRNAKASRSMTVTPKEGKSTIPVYGRPLPEAAAYKNNVPVVPLAPLQYSIGAGQAYPAYDRKAANDYFYVTSIDRSQPGDGTLIVGEERYIPIEYNHRQAFVKAKDVDLSWH